MKRLICGLLLILLGGCSEMTLTRQQTGEVHKIGIISAIGDELNIRSFAPDSGHPDGLIDRGSIADLALDAYVVEQATVQLKDKYEVVPVAYQPGIFHQTEREQSLHAGVIQGRPLGQVIRATTQLPTGMAAGTGSGVDIYLVFLSGRAKLQTGDQSLYGTSLSRLPSTDNASAYNLGVVYWISVIDGHTLQPIGNVNTLSDHAVDPALWADRVDALTAAQRRQLAAIWQKRIDLTLAPALRKLNLIED